MIAWRLLVTRPNRNVSGRSIAARARSRGAAHATAADRAYPARRAWRRPWCRVFTSANAVRPSAHRRFSSLPICPYTWAATQAAPRGRIYGDHVGYGDVSALVSLIASKPPVANSPLYCAGETEPATWRVRYDYTACV